MPDGPLWHDAAALAARAHRSQIRKDGRTPYMAHPTRVALIVATVFGVTDEITLAAALLHDVIEDCDCDYDEVVEVCGHEVADIVASLSKDMRLVESERERAYDRQLADGPWAARLIKLADVYDNLRDATTAERRRDTIEKAERVLALAAGDARLAGPAGTLRRSSSRSGTSWTRGPAGEGPPGIHRPRACLDQRRRGRRAEAMGTILNLLAPGSVLLAMLCACGPGPDAPAEAPPETSTGTEVMAETPAAVTTEAEAESPDESPLAAPDRMRVEVPEDPPADPVVVAPADPPRLPGSTPAVNPRPPSTAPAPPPDAMPEPPSDPVIALLDRLAENDVGLTGFTASITYQKIDALLGRRETRKGRLIYAVDAERAGKRFAILFDSITIGRRKRTQLKHYVFDGRWLAEIDHEGKQFIKREIVAPGRELNPLKLGEGPFPLPIGQPRNEVLRRFEVDLCPRPEEGLLTVLPEDVHGIRLVPRPGTDEAEEFEYVLLFFDRVTLLPVGSHVVERADEAGESDETFVRLADLARNPVLDAADLARLSIEEPDAREWRVDIRPWQER